jgi:methylated-DNA-[protein]-cysteine S-methyltransferase
MSAKQAVRESFPHAFESSCPEIDILLDKLESFLCGEDVVFSLDVLNLDPCTEFQKKVLFAEHAVPRGAVSTYGLIAKHLGNPRGARAVGMALANNPFPFVIPCHRTIRSDGTLGGFGGGQDMKKKLLEMEGITFLQSGQVAERTFFYDMYL